MIAHTAPPGTPPPSPPPPQPAGPTHPGPSGPGRMYGEPLPKPPTGEPPPPPTPKYREWPYIALFLLGVLIYGSAMGVLLAEWAVKSS